MSNNINSDIKTNETKEIVPNLDSFTKDGFKILTNSIRHSNALPANSDWNFYKLNESFCNVINNEGNRLLRLVNSILKKYDIEDNMHIRKSIEDKIELIIEANDTILEKVGDNLDELNGIKKRNVEPVEFQTVTAELPISESWNRINKATFSVSTSVNSPRQNVNSTRAIHLLTGKNIIRPQKFFKDKIDNSNNYPWQPRITEKPNSIRPLALFLEETEFGESFCHPYQTELDIFEPSPAHLKAATPIEPKPISETPIHMIETADKLNDLVEELRKHSIIGIDLEHHSYRTFMGITCLMQISTTEADYIIDTLALRDKLYVLNEIFTRPSIIKVFHGANSDIPWLQRDLSLYVVNMFDTHQAAKQLGYSGLSLAYLLQRFCKFIPNKQFQLADWRMRPLPQELINYAREDTHYLIYLYGILRNELLKRGNGKDNILKSVIQMSTEVCKKRYFKPIMNNDSHLDFYRKCKRLFDNRQMYALKELYQWRDKMAREEDESTGYVLPNHMLLQISEMIPREMQGVLACCNPIPPLVRANLLELHQIVLKAREQSAEKPIMKEDNRGQGSTQQFSKINVDSSLYCPHDLTKQSEFRDDLAVLLCEERVAGSTTIISSNFNRTLEKKQSRCSVFNTPENLGDDDDKSLAVKLNSLKFLGPYERYKLVRPYIQAEEKKKAAAENTKKNEEPDDTDDRIASLHEHFVKVAKDCPPPPQTNEPEKIEKSENSDQQFTKMLDGNYHSLAKEDGVNVKKRKFEEDCQPLKYLIGAIKRKKNNASSATLHPDHNTEGNPLHTPVPNLINNDGQVKRKKPNKRKRKNKKQHQPANSQNTDNPQSTTETPLTERDKIKAFFNRKNRWGNRKNTADNNSSQDVSDFNQSGGPSGSTDFSPFDYSSVDYRQFQGGASNNSNKKGFKAKYRGKNKKKYGGKKNNKFSTFDNSKKMNI